MYEIEAKVPLKKADLKRLQELLPAFASLKGDSVKKDDYYGTFSDFSFRIRQKNGRAILNLKSKRIEKGVEMNQEAELNLKSASGFHRFLHKIGVRRFASKEKQSQVFIYKDLQIELNHVVGLGDYLEIEAKALTTQAIPAAKKKMEALFATLGFKPHQFEKKYYLDLLQAKAKKH